MILRARKNGDPGMTRTCDLRFRKPPLYPAELRDRSGPLTAAARNSIYQSRMPIASLRIAAGRTALEALFAETQHRKYRHHRRGGTWNLTSDPTFSEAGGA